MRPVAICQHLAAVTGLLALLLIPPLVVAAPTTAQSWGKQIYQKGTSPTGGEITAIVGTEGVSLPASAVPCASCHGEDGLGRPEGGVLPPDIRWSELTKIYGHVHEDGRQHPAFDDVSLARLIRTGLDPAGNRLDPSMPLYLMSVEDMDSLLAYLQFLEKDWDPGVAQDRIQVATLLPLNGPRGALGQAMAQVMHAYFKELNDKGGVFGRKLELLVIPYGNSPQATLDNVRLALDKEGILALVGAYTVGLDEQLLDLLRSEGVPLVGPFTLNPGDAFVNADSFYIYPGFAEQAAALAKMAVKEMSKGQTGLVLIGPEDEMVDTAIRSARRQLPRSEADRSDTIRYQRGQFDAVALAERLQAGDSEDIIFLGNQNELKELLDALAQRQFVPRLYLLSALMARPLFDAPEAFHYRIFLAYPTLSTDINAAGLAEYRRLADLHALPPGHIQGQIAALAAAKLLVEGLRGAGRTLSRQGLVDGIEALYRYDTGLTPPLTYGPNRRIGARGAHIMAVDLIKKTNTQVGEWHEVR